MSDFDKAWKVAKESEDDWIFNDWDNDVLEDGRPQWTMMQECSTCGSIQISNNTGWTETRELCSDGAEDHDWEMIDARRTDERGMALPICGECGEEVTDCYCQDEHGNYIHP
jgi:hypothetical protein